MEPYQLKDKISITSSFLSDLESKGWQEIDMLQNQIANIEANKENAPVIQLLNSLLTSYYVFIGGLENLSNSSNIAIVNQIEEPIVKDEQAAPEDNELIRIEKPYIENSNQPEIEVGTFEPFEYFVDFDEPTGSPLSDEDLYGN
jgi:hypothetical protein